MKTNQVKFSRAEREIAELLVGGLEPKDIAAAVEKSAPSIYRRLAYMCVRCGVTGRPQLLIWILQNPSCVCPGQHVPAGLHPPDCLCDSPHCQWRVLAEKLKQQRAA